MRLKVLGEMELVSDRQQLKIGGPREYIVLAALALKPNRVTSMDQLVDAVWGDSPPATARAQIHSSISKLRKLFSQAGDGDAIETRPSGYLLNLAAEALDSELFTKLIQRAHDLTAEQNHEQAVATLGEALELWRGEAFDGVQSDVVRQGATVLEDSRLSAIEERIRLDLEMGRHDAVIGELRALCVQHPLRERMYGFLMLALYRSGRQAEAIEVYRDARATLLAEAGIEPCTELRNLQHAVLNREPALDPPKIQQDVPVADPSQLNPRQLPSGIADFVGREQEIEAIHEVLRHCRHGGGVRFAVPVIAISGRPGIGKSALALRIAHELTEHFPDGHLYADLRCVDDEQETQQQLARFLRALGFLDAVISADPRNRVEAFRSSLANRRQLVVLDNMVGEHQVEPLLPGNPDCAVIVTSRRRLSGLPVTWRIDLDAFDHDTAAELLARIVGWNRLTGEPEALSELVRRCEGLPLALRIVGARLAARPSWPVAELTRRVREDTLRLDELAYGGLDLRASLAVSYQNLPDPAQRLFRLFSLVGAPDAPAWTAAALLGCRLHEAEEVLETLVDEQLLETVQGEARGVRYRFADLVRCYAGELLHQHDSEQERRSASERLLCAWLALAERAHRREYGGNYTVLHGSAERWHVPGLPIDELVAEPLDWLESEREALVDAVRQAAAASLDEVCWDLALTSVSLFEVRGYTEDWRDTAELAYATAERADNRVGRAAMLYSLGTLHMRKRSVPAAERCFEPALELFVAERNTHGQALTLRNWAFIDRIRGDFDAMRRKCDDALEKMRSVGDVVGEATILRVLAKYEIDEGDPAVAERMLSEALELCQRANYLRGEVQVVSRFAELYLSTDRVLQARRSFHRVLRAVRGLGDLVGEAHALYGLASVRRREGNVDTAELTLTQAIAVARRSGDRLVEAQAHFALGEINVAVGRTETAASELTTAADLLGEVDSPLRRAKALALLAEVYESTADTDAASRAMAQAIELLEASDSQEAADLLKPMSEAYSAFHDDCAFGGEAFGRGDVAPR